MSDDQQPTAERPAVNPPQPAPADAPERDAIVYLAGLPEADAADSVDAVARRIAAALDDEASPELQFLLEEGRNEDYGKQRGIKGKTRKITVTRQDRRQGPRQAILDLYSLDYRETLIGDLPEKRPLSLLLLICWTLLTNSGKLLFSIGSRSKTSTEKWQVRIACLWFSTLILYAVIILGAVLGTLLPAALPTSAEAPPIVVQAGAGQPPAADESTPAPSTPPADAPTDAQGLADTIRTRVVAFGSHYLQPIAYGCQLLVVWLAALGLVFKRDLKAIVQKSGVETISAVRYLTLGTAKDAITNMFSALLNHLAEKDDLKYRNVYVVAYSFGTLATLDALYPHGEPPGIFGTVRGLITIGCPFDFIRTYWPDYFKNRCSDDTSRTWLNIFARPDVLSSDFLDVAAKGADPVEAGIAISGVTTLLRPRSILYGRDKSLDDYGLLERYGLVGFRAHTRYWEEDTAGCYRDIVREILADQAEPT
ncbi:MAG: hypothetical protein H7A46_17035 [Verrucomicrobiales bacterium]|nr:hypothetical protein [Verrucomicrobiales bacterium]